MNEMQTHDVLRKVLADDEPDVFCELMKVFLEALMGVEADSMWRRLRRTFREARELPQRLPPRDFGRKGMTLSRECQS